MAVFTFCPNSQVPRLMPRETSNTVTLNGWTFSARPISPMQRKFEVKVHGLRWYLNSDGTFDTTTDPTHNARLLELFYQDHEMWNTFTWNHPHLGALNVRFASPLSIPPGRENSGGLIDAFDMTLVEGP